MDVGTAYGAAVLVVQSYWAAVDLNVRSTQYQLQVGVEPELTRAEAAESVMLSYLRAVGIDVDAEEFRSSCRASHPGQTQNLEGLAAFFRRSVDEVRSLRLVPEIPLGAKW